MTKAAEYEALLRAAIRHENDQVISLARCAAASARHTGNVNNASRIEHIINTAGYTTQSPLLTLGSSKTTAVVGVEPRCKLGDLVLVDDVRHVLQGLFTEQRAGAEIAEKGLHPDSRILLYGPSGLGKTSLAHAIASEMGLPLREVVMEGIIESHMGDSGRNLHEVWKFIRPQRCVLLLDEFDSLCMKRGGNESGASQETSRITSTILRGLESLPWTVIVIACTNIRDNLDAAVFRRFHRHIEMPVPSEETLLGYATGLAGKYGCQLDCGVCVGTTFAEAEMEVMRIAKRRIIEQIRG